jgi:hypothetical protein
MTQQEFNLKIEEINNREKDCDGCIEISRQEFLMMKEFNYERPSDIEMYIVRYYK